MRRIVLPAIIAAGLLAVLGLLLLAAPPGYTRLGLSDVDRGEVLLDAVLRNREPVTLTWHNSIYDLPVVEVFYAEDGRLVLDRVSFLDPEGNLRNPVQSSDVKDLYHTGGPFSASGMDRPYKDVIFRIGEIGDPHLTARDVTVALKDEVGFGGRVRLTADRPALWRIVARDLADR